VKKYRIDTALISSKKNDIDTISTWYHFNINLVYQKEKDKNTIWCWFF